MTVRETAGQRARAASRRRIDLHAMRALAFAAALSVTASAAAEVSEPSPHEDSAFDLMNVLSRHGVHDLNDESWNLYGQFTHISSWKAPFSAPYTSPIRSLSTSSEYSFTNTLTFMVDVRPWPKAELVLVPEILMMQPLSGLTGLGGAVQNAELQKGGGIAPQIYQSRAYLRQRIDLGGHAVVKTSDPMQLGTVVDSRRLVFIVGNFSVIDFFDKNAFSGDLRRQLINMDFLTYSAYDFAADARGYGYGGIAELYWDDWAFRIGRVTPPQDPNQEPLDFRLDRHYGDQIEIEHHHDVGGRPGAVRLLGFRNRENMAAFRDAIAAFASDPSRFNAANCGARFSYQSPDANAPDLCWARKTNVKVGVGVNVEQQVAEDVGLFLRAMIADGRTEVYSFMSSDRSLSFGAVAGGARWGRPDDLAALGVGVSWISSAHADYLRLGGIDGFIGDGTIRPAAETVLEAMYSFAVAPSLWLSADVQHIANPAYNADRGPVWVLGGRAHAEF